VIQKSIIEDFVNSFIKGTDFFVVDIKVSTANKIQVYIDSPVGIDIETCIELSRYIESQLDREVEDFELDVSSAGLSDPFKVHQQYLKNLNREVCVVLTDGKKITGELTKVTDDSITLIYEEIAKVGAKGRRKKVEQENEFSFSDIKQTTVVVSFKK